MINPLVSVIIPMFNAEEYIKETLKSIFNQTYKNVEVIIVDDGSTDNSKDVVMKYFPEVKYIYENNSGGAAKPRNEGFKISKGELITFFGSDDIMVPNKIEMQVEVLYRFPNVKATFVDYKNFGGLKLSAGSHFATCEQLKREFEEQGSEVVVLSPDKSYKILLSENYASVGLLRREVWEKIGPFREELKQSQDFEFYYRVAKHFDIAIVNKLGFYRRIHSNNMSLNIERALKYKIMSREIIYQAEKERDLKKRLKRAISGYYLDLGYYYAGKNRTLSIQNSLESLRYKKMPTYGLIRNLVKAWMIQY